MVQVLTPDLCQLETGGHSNSSVPASRLGLLKRRRFPIVRSALVLSLLFSFVSVNEVRGKCIYFWPHFLYNVQCAIKM